MHQVITKVCTLSIREGGALATSMMFRLILRYCIFGVKPSFISGLKIYPSKIPRMDLKMIRTIKNGPPYGARGSSVLLRPNNKVKLLTKSAENWICMIKLALEILAKLVLKNKKASDNWTFSSSGYATTILRLKGFTEKFF